jgi:hypothetical protein
VQELAKNFLPVADGIDAGSGQPAAEALFKKIHAQDKWNHAKQGIRAVTPSGLLLGSGPTTDPKGVADMLADAWKKYQALDKKERLLAEAPAALPAHGGPDYWKLYPKGGLVLEYYVRDLPRPTGMKWNVEPKPASDLKLNDKAGIFNRDYAWFTREEVRSLIPASRQPGAQQVVPDKLVRRLARFHLVDNVLGQIGPFANEDVQKAELTVSVDKVVGDALHLTFAGETRTARSKNDTPVRGYEAKLLGKALYDLKQEQFTNFSLVAVGTRWGSRGEATWQDPDGTAPAPLGVAFRLPDKSATGSEQTPPASVRRLKERYFTLEDQ